MSGTAPRPPLRDPDAPRLDDRVVRTRAAVLRTALDLLVAGGPSAVTVDAIVARSGVAKSTIYRHWDTRDDILIDVMQEAAPNLVTPDPSLGFREALRELLRTTVELFNDPEWARVLPSLLLLKIHVNAIADIERRMERQQLEVVGEVIARGEREGLLRPGIEVADACAFLVGPLFFGHITGEVQLGDEFVERTIDVFLAAHAAEPT